MQSGKDAVRSDSTILDVEVAVSCPSYSHTLFVVRSEHQDVSDVIISLLILSVNLNKMDDYHLLTQFNIVPGYFTMLTIDRFDDQFKKY